MIRNISKDNLDLPYWNKTNIHGLIFILETEVVSEKIYNPPELIANAPSRLTETF